MGFGDRLRSLSPRFVFMYLAPMRRKYSIGEAPASLPAIIGFSAAHRAFLERHDLNDIGRDEGFAESLRGKVAAEPEGLIGL